MPIHFPSQKAFWLLALSYSFLAFSGCSPKIKIGLWAKKHREAALALGIWAANNANEATTLLNVDCTDRKQFKKKITYALHNTPAENPARQNDATGQYKYLFRNSHAAGSIDGFASWCRQYPKAAKKLRSHAKALCKTGMGILNGSIIGIYK